MPPSSVPSTPAPAAPPPPDPLLTVRAALIFLIAILIGVAAGWLLSLKGAQLPEAILGGAASCAGAVTLLQTIIK